VGGWGGTRAGAGPGAAGGGGTGPVDQADGLNLIDRRPNTGWQDWDQVRDLAFQADPPAVRQAKLDALKPYLALSAWVDGEVIRPNAKAQMVGNYTSWAGIKLAHETYPALTGTREPDFERNPVLPGGKIVGRAPVDLAWARTRRPVLIALLANLKGLYLDLSTARPSTFGDGIGTIRSAEIPLDWRVISDCRVVAVRIMDSTDNLLTWEQWNAFCDALPFAGIPNLRQTKRDVLKANFNPNSRLNKFSPNASLWRSGDKSDLLVYSTEFSLLPRSTAQELESVGRILGKDGRLLASRTLRAFLAPASRLTLSTQKEFVCEDLGDLSVVGDEACFRLPGQAGTPFISRSAGTGRTWGHALGLAGLGDSGASLQTYPEPCVVAGAGAVLSIRPADYDGSIQLATVETPDQEWYGVPAPPALPTRDMKLLARYTVDMDLDLADAAPPRPSADERRKNQPDTEQVTYNGGGPANLSELGNGLWDAARPNTLYPDGVYSEKDRAPSYLDKGNADGFHGVISFWIKSNHASTAIGTRGHPFLKWTNFTEGYAGGGSPDQFFFLGDSGRSGASGVVCSFEIGHSLSDDLMEHRFQRNRGLTPHQWSLVTMYYDFRSPDKHECGELRMNAGRADMDKGSYEAYPPSAGNNPAWASDITVDHLISPPGGLFGPHRLVLGKGRDEIEILDVRTEIGSGADATLDELAIYDFGGAEPITGTTDVTPASQATRDSPGVLAAKRFKEGRYYKESDYTGLLASPGMNKAGEYFSPLISLGPCRIRALAWTQVVPRGLKAPLPSFGPDGVTPGQPGIDGDEGDDGRILLELANASGRDYLDDLAGQPIAQTFSSPASSPVERVVNAPFRLHAVFQPNLADKENTPILDPLALDDVTVVYEPLGGRRITTWKESR
jgi:hypothetical protein